MNPETTTQPRSPGEALAAAKLPANSVSGDPFEGLETIAGPGPHGDEDELPTEPADPEDELPTGTIEPAPDPDGTALFDATDYDREDLAIPKVDGQGVDKIRVGFTGSLMLDRSRPEDVALYNRLTLGRNVELRVSGEVTSVSTGWTTNRDGDLDAIVGERKVKISTVYVLAAEEL